MLCFCDILNILIKVIHKQAVIALVVAVDHTGGGSGIQLCKGDGRRNRSPRLRHGDMRRHLLYTEFHALYIVNRTHGPVPCIQISKGGLHQCKKAHIACFL